MKKSLVLVIISCIAMLSQAQTPCVDGMAGIYPCNEVDLLSQVALADVGGIQNFNDIWGWTDSESGREFALVGMRNGTSFIEVTDPLSPIYIGFLGTASTNSLWRDIKVYDNHAFIGAEANFHGMQVFDLTHLLEDFEELPVVFESDAHYDTFGRSHNIVINEESGYAFGVGTTTYNGGLHFVDISDPLNPEIAGGFDADGYTHDAQVVIYDGPDEDYIGKEIAFACNEDAVTIIDVTDKTDPEQISTFTYGDSEYTHQGWLTEDMNFFIFNDELDEMNGVTEFTKTYFLDVSDLDEPVLHMEYFADVEAIDHNLYNRGSLCYQSNYRSGLRILDVGNVYEQEVSELAYFDCQPGDDNPSFSGTWSNYVYFASGTVIMTDMYSDLFILRPTLINSYRYAESCSNGQSVEYYIDVTYDEQIDDAYSYNTPEDVTVSFGEIEAPGRIPVTVEFSDDIEVGDYNIPVALSYEGNILVDQTLRLIIDNGPQITGLAPADGFEATTAEIELSWDAIPDLDTYTITISDSEDLSNILVQETVEGTSFMTDLEGVFYWSVVATESECQVGTDPREVSNMYFGVAENSYSIDIYPNPVKKELNISGIEGNFQVIDANGRVVLSFNTLQNKSVDVSSLSPGIYMLRLAGSYYQARFIKE